MSSSYLLFSGICPRLGSDSVTSLLSNVLNSYITIELCFKKIQTELQTLLGLYKFFTGKTDTLLFYHIFSLFSLSHSFAQLVISTWYTGEKTTTYLEMFFNVWHLN